MDSEGKRSIKVCVLGEDESPSVSPVRGNGFFNTVFPVGEVEIYCIGPGVLGAFENKQKPTVSFIDFQRCARLLGKYPGCMLFYRCYRSLCPMAWTERWFEQMENGTFPKKIYPSKPIVKLDEKTETICADDDEEEEEEEVPC